jgi:aminoglycoside 3-N-acetyltransferase
MEMTEKESIINTTSKPNTVTTLVNDFKSLGVREGMVLLMHSSLSSLGWVCGGPVAVILALEEALTEKGTLIMPAHSGDYSDPGEWCNPPVPESWWDTIRSEMPLFDKNLTPTRAMGRIAETFRKQDGVMRSGHPTLSFSAWGKHKEYVLQDEHFDYALNEKSPLGRLYELNGKILLLGVDHSNNTSLHLAEYKAAFAGKKTVANGLPAVENGNKVWKYVDDIDISSDDFNEIGLDYEKENGTVLGKVGNANARLLDQRHIVDFAAAWIEKNRR